MVGKNKSLLKLIKDSQGESPLKKIDIGCSCHLAHLCTEKGAKVLSIQDDDFVIDLGYVLKEV